MGPSEAEEQAERRRVMLQDADVRRQQGTTFSSVRAGRRRNSPRQVRSSRCGDRDRLEGVSGGSLSSLQSSHAI